MFLRGEPYEPHERRPRALAGHRHRLPGPRADRRAVGLPEHVPAPRAASAGRCRSWPTARCARETREALDEIGINIPSLNAPVARLSGGQRQAIAVARTVHSEADILLLDEPLAAMGAKEGALILDLIAAPQGRGRGLDHHGPAQLRPRAGELRPGQPDPGRRDRARQADVGDVGRGAHRDRRRRVPARAPGGQRAGEPARDDATSSASTSGRCRRAPSSCDAARRRRARRRRCTSTRTAVIERDAGRLRRRAPAAVGAAGSRRTTSRRCATAVPAAVARGRHRARARSSGIAHRLHRLARRCRCCADGTPLCQVPGFEDRPHAYAEAVEAPRRPAPGRPHQRARRRARRAVAGALRRADLVRVGVRQGAAGARGGPRGLRAHGALDRGAPTGSSGSSAARETRNVCTAGYKGDPPGRPLSRREDYLRALDERFADFVGGEARRAAVAARRARGRPHRAGGGVDRAARGDRGRGRQRRRARHRAGRRARSTPARCSWSWAPRPATS